MKVKKPTLGGLRGQGRSDLCILALCSAVARYYDAEKAIELA
jgi:hypothetical protein